MEILKVGVGGEGIKAGANFIGYNLKSLGKNVLVSATYGSEMRGSPSDSQICVEDLTENIQPLYPKKTADLVIALSESGLIHKKDSVDKKTFILYNSNSKFDLSDYTDNPCLGVPLNEIATIKGRQINSNMSALGSAFRVMDVKLDDLVKSINENHSKVGFKEKDLEKNLQAAINGYTYANDILKNKNIPLDKLKITGNYANRAYFLDTGNKLALWGLIAGGVSVYTGYPITPSSDIMELASKIFPKNGDVYIQFEDEIASIRGLIGAAIAGRLGATATSGPGFSLMREVLGSATSCMIPCVVINVQRGGPSTGQPTLPSQGDIASSIYTSHGDAMANLVYSPSNISEAYFLSKRACRDTAEYRLPAIFLSDGLVGSDMSLFRINLDEEFKKIIYPEITLPKHTETLAHNVLTGQPNSTDPAIAKQTIDEFLKAHKKSKKIFTYELYMNGKNRTDLDEKAKYTIISFGSPVGAARQVADSYDGIRLMSLPILWPIQEEAFERIAASSDRIIVPELNASSQYLRFIMAPLERGVERKNIIPVNKYDGTRMFKEDIESVM